MPWNSTLDIKRKKKEIKRVTNIPRVGEFVLHLLPLPSYLPKSYPFLKSVCTPVLYSYACSCCLLFRYLYAVFGMSTCTFASGKYSSLYCWLAGPTERLQLYSFIHSFPFSLESSPSSSSASSSSLSTIRQAVKSLSVAYILTFL